nr:molybdenum cofactor sulfurase-like [Tanacetum cinerariifolium]
MSSPCIKEVSRACLRRCCPTPLLGLPDKRTSEQVSPSRYDFIAATAFSLQPNAQFTNHESLPDLNRSFSNMKKAYPNYSETEQADRVRDQEYYQLSVSNHVCLDYIGHGLFSYSQQLHSNAPFFNIIYKYVNLYTQITHGGQEPEFESLIKERIFRFMNISSDDYSLVFTANQSSAFKVLADSYPFQTNRNLLTVYDHENEPVDKMIDSCRKRSGRVDSAVFSWPNMKIQSKRLRKSIINKNKKKRKKRGLFVFPLQSKVTGSRYSYLWMSLAQENGWHVCLDANALGDKDMETLGLSLFQPDFLICSFYKVFGENPSGFGCLFIKKSRSSVLKNSATSTGMVSIVQASNRPLFLQESGSIDSGRKKDIRLESSSSTSSSYSNQEMFEIQEIKETKKEKKQLSFSEVWKLDRSLDISESRKNEASSSGVSSDIEFRGLDNADSLGLVLISTRVRYLVNWLVNAFGSLKHPHSEDGVPLVRIYGPKVRVDRGPVVAFNVFDWKGAKVEPTLVQKLADRHNISLTCATLTHVSFVDKASEEKEILVEVKSMENKVHNSPTTTKKKEKFELGIPVIMATLGYLTNFEDVYKVWTFVSRFLDADFVEKERWRYMALNQTTVEV